MNIRKTKITVTVGPAIDTPQMLEKVFDEGTDVFRINFSHGTHPYHLKNIRKIRKIAARREISVAIMGDLKGPEIRTDENTYDLLQGKQVYLTYFKDKKKTSDVGISHEHFYKLVSKGQVVFADDGNLEFKVLSVTAKRVFCKIITGGFLDKKKSINVPNVDLKLPILSTTDKKNLDFTIKNKLDWVAISFANSASDVHVIKKYLKQKKGVVQTIAKIESARAIDNLEEIVDASEGIMVARGDLGVELPIERIPLLQQKIIQEAKKKGKVVIVATQMLDSMMNNPRPTRAEATDIFNAALEKVDSVMLSGETASGKYPIKAIECMKRIILETQQQYSSDLQDIQHPEEIAIICKTSLTLALESKAKFLVTISLWGKSARIISSYRSSIPTVVASNKKMFTQRSSLYYSVVPLLIQSQNTPSKQIQEVEKQLKQKKLVQKKDIIIFMFTYPSTKASTNTIRKWIIK